MTTATYPDLHPAALAVLIAAQPGEALTPELVTRAIGRADLPADTVRAIMAHLAERQMVHDDILTPLAAAIGRMARKMAAAE